MSDFDASLAIAELEGWVIKCQHHFRQMSQNGDVETAAIFSVKLGVLKGLADMNLHTMKRPRWHVTCDCGIDLGIVDKIQGGRREGGVLLCDCGLAMRFEKV